MVTNVQPRIAFAIPYYRGRDLLIRALQSVLEQDIDDWEAVVVDDAGPEPAADIVEKLNDPRISYLRNHQNLGLAGNWMTAIRATTAPLVTVFHADDELLPNYALTMIQLMERQPKALAGHCRVELIDVNGSPTRTLADDAKKMIRPHQRGDVTTAGDRGLASLLRGFWIFCPTLCYRRDLFQTVEPFDGRWNFVVDFSFVGRALLDGHQIVGSSEVAYRYRRHSDNQTARLTAKLVRFEEELGLYGELSALARDRSWMKSARIAQRASIVRVHLVVNAIASFTRGHRERSWQALRLATRKVRSIE